MSEKPRLSFWQIWNMSFGFLGIQFGFALQNANMSRIFETLGAKESEIPILWLAAPVTGLLIQPVIGYMSDRTWSNWGRRKPYFLTGAILASMALCIMPHASHLWMAAGLLWILDASINVSMEPSRALIGDMLPEEQRTQGFAVQTFFISVGAIVASLMPEIFNRMGVSNTAGEGQIPTSVAWSFYLGAAVFISAVIWTVSRTKEYPPDEFARYNPLPPEEDKEDGLEVIANPVIGLWGDLRNAPRAMWELGAVQFFTWFALFTMWIYTTRIVAGQVFGSTDTTTAAYNEGADWVGVCFAVYNVFAAIFAFLLPPLARAIGQKTVHAGALLIGGMSLASFYLITDKEHLLVAMAGIGLAWASILSMPYAMLSNSLPANKMGLYIGVFNFFIVIPQITCAAVLGWALDALFGGQVIFTIVAAGISMSIAAMITLVVKAGD